MSTTADTRRTRRRAALGATLAGGCLCVSLAACSSSDDSPRDEEFTAVSAATGSAAQTTEFEAPGAELSSPVPRASNEAGPLAGSQPLDVLPEDETRLNVAEVRTGSHEDFDRIVVELDGTGAPGWRVSTEDSPTSDGSGLPISYDGETALVIDVRGVVTPTDSTGSTSSTGRTPVHEKANGVVRSVDVQGVVEGVQRIVIGLKNSDPSYKVTLLDSPTRIVVDITRRD
ncbi:hypothetical protein AALF15_05680 [Corynebacteriaceae bacterium 7-707]